MTIADVTLEDKYTLEEGHAFMTGVQAVARLLMLQRRADLAAGLNTAGYVSGYRGSPLGGVDQALWAARRYLEAHRVHFEPGVNEDIAATAIHGTQQAGFFGRQNYDGVFALWYGKGPGVDRTGDAFRHANYAGTARHGGVIALVGDDHAAKSSAHAHQSEHTFKALAMPVVAPANVQEILDFGLHAWALSRYCGCWVAMKTVSDVVESSATVVLDPGRVRPRLPQDFTLPPDGLNLRWPDPVLAQEFRMHHFKIYAALAYVRANGLNQLVWDSPRPRLGIITGGKSYLDVRQALDDLGIDEATAADLGIRLFKVGVPWPLEAGGVRRFAEGLEEILVVEEKRQIIEYQLKEELYNWREDVRPRVVGKFDEGGEWSAQPGDWLLPPTTEHTPAIVARAIGARIGRFHRSSRMDERLAVIDARERAANREGTRVQRIPYFCSGCPHNTSTVVPEGSMALGGVGCHLMAVNMNRSTVSIAHMGGEGANWIGAHRFVDASHVFANMGDGTYFHSGLLAIRAAIAARAPITYKLLYNDAVAMTGGQPVEGGLGVAQIARQLAAEGVGRIVLVTDDPTRYVGGGGLPSGVPVLPRDALARVQRELREYRGVSAILYDQVCATEKRRRRKRGTVPAADEYVYIHPEVCEGCGDCSAASNCLSIVPLDTPLGRKRRIDQPSCNQDLSCLKGFCPALVSVRGGRPRRVDAPAAAGSRPPLPEPVVPAAAEPWGILIAGVGGTGVVTVGALLGVAAHLDAKAATGLDQAGLSQKAGAVTSHVRICDRLDRLHAARIATGESNLVLGCDIVVAAGGEALSRMLAGVTRSVVNTHETITGEFIRDPDFRLPIDDMRRALGDAVAPGDAAFVDATATVQALQGDTIGANVFMLGYAWQRGWVPLSGEAIRRAIEMNGVAVALNLEAFEWGRCAAHDPAAVEAAAGTAPPAPRPLAALVDDHAARLVEYQDHALAERYRALVARAQEAEHRAGGDGRFAQAVATGYARVLAVKDEYEVARLYASPGFDAALKREFEGAVTLRYHFAPAWLGAKRSYGAWMRGLLGIVAGLRRLRGTGLDVFGASAERRLERRWVGEYEQMIERAAARLRPDTLEPARAVAQLAFEVRGFGPVRQRNYDAAKRRAETLMSSF